LHRKILAAIGKLSAQGSAPNRIRLARATISHHFCKVLFQGFFFKGVQVTNKGDQSDPYSKIASNKKVSGVLFRWKSLLGDMMINQWIYVFL
jgi:hypothetical protein